MNIVVQLFRRCVRGIRTLFESFARLILPPRVFISYRHSESLDFSERLADDLRRVFGHANVFIDTDIEDSAVWPDVLRNRVEAADCVVAVIGPEWLSPTNTQRLRDPNDWVRNEVAMGLKEKRLQVVLYNRDSAINEAALREAGVDDLMPLHDIQQQLRIRSDLGYHDGLARLVDDVCRARRSVRGWKGVLDILTSNSVIFGLSILPLEMPRTSRTRTVRSGSRDRHGNGKSNCSFARRVGHTIRAKQFLFAVLTLLLIVYVATPWQPYDDKLNDIVSYYDPKCFALGANSKRPSTYDICRGLPSSDLLNEETNLKNTIDQARTNFDILVLHGGVIEAFSDDFESAIKRKVKLRIIMTDHSKDNWPNVKPYYELFLPAENPDQKWRDGLSGVQRHLERLQELGKSDRCVEIRQLRGPYLHSMWIVDKELQQLDQAVAHLAIPFRGRTSLPDAAKGDIILRFGRLSPRMVTTISTEFDNIWQKCSPWKPGSHIW